VLIGGYIAVPSAIGQGAAAQVLRILQGERAAAIPVSESNYVKPIFDWRQLRRWGISEGTLPPGSEIRFRELTIWQQYFWQMAAISAVVVLESLLLVALLYEDRRRRRSEANALALAGELAHMNRIATAGQLTASIAHEIRQPLGAIGAFGTAGINWLRHKTPDLEIVRSSLQNIVKEVHRADEVIKSVTALFMKKSTARTKFNLNRLVQQVLTSTAQAIDTNRVVLQTNFLDSPPPVVIADPIQLQQVILKPHYERDRVHGRFGKSAKNAAY
jgi:signal transduction histidine kinase